MDSKRRREAPPTDAELDVLGVLWKNGASTVRDVHETLAPSKQVGYTTTLKQMQVMHAKGLLVRSERYRAHVYEARHPKTRTRRQLAQSLLRRAFDGSSRELLQSALAGRRIGAGELAEIRQLLDEIGAKHDD